MFLSKKGDISLPALLGLILSFTILVVLLTASCKIINFAGPKDNNFKDVFNSINSFANPEKRGSTISNQYPIKLSEKNIILGFNPSVDSSELDFSFYREDGSHYLDKTLEIPKPSSCNDNFACLCFCEEYEITDNVLKCETYSCASLNESVYFENYLFEGSLYKREGLRVDKSIPTSYQVEFNGGFTLTYYGIIGTFFDDVKDYVFSHDYYKLQWVNMHESIAFCDDKNALTKYNVCVD